MKIQKMTKNIKKSNNIKNEKRSTKNLEMSKEDALLYATWYATWYANIRHQYIYI